MKKILVILGPTSSGKTSLSIKLCKEFGGEIISADSRQIYKHMDIGTGKIPIKENTSIKKDSGVWNLDGVNIWGYDLTTPDKYFSSYDFCSWSLNKAKKLLSTDKNVFLVGGTGFYIDMFTGKIKPSGIPPDFDLREKLQKMSTLDLIKKLGSLNKNALETIDRNNPVRLIRAVEIELGEKKIPKLPYLKNVKFEYIELTASNNFLYNRVDKWVEEIWKGGLIEETKKLIELGYKATRPLNGLVYKTTIDFINNEKSKEETIDRIKYDLHAYIRRQKTYFKRNTLTEQFDISEKEFFQSVSNNVQLKLDG